ncbi:hypothetical protein P8610_18065 [Fictibacillus sp. UD]|uniref:hypothetical protein n=1 Tax=Fictibacillus sp. UD TaxID=3038777 RepID=UPI0037476432
MKKNPSTNDQVIVKNEVLPLRDIQFPSGIKDAVETDWKVEILLEEHPEFTGNVFIAKFTSKRGRTNPIYCLCSDLYDKKKQKELIRELVNRGRFYPDELEAFIQYVDCLKVAGLIISNDEGYKQHILGTTELTNFDEANNVYRAIVEHAIENNSAFPDKGNFREEYDGIRFTDAIDKLKYGEYSIAFEAKKFRELIDMPNTKIVNAILADLANRSLFFPGSFENRKKVTLRAGYAPHCYIFKIDDSVLSQGGM